MPTPRKDKRLDPNSDEMQKYVNLIDEIRIHYETTNVRLWQKTMDWWDLFLAIQEDKRDPVDEQWRSNVFVPLPYVVTRTKAAHLVKNLANVEPIWQVEATREKGKWYEQSKHIERYVDYVHRANKWRKLLYKLAIGRSVQGTAFFKVIYGKRAHNMTLYPSQDEFARFQEAVTSAVEMGAPQPPSWSAEPEAFEKWRELINAAQRFQPIPAAPSAGPRQITEYEGPIFQYVPMWSLRMDATIDEIGNQKVIIHRMVKPLSYILARADDDPLSSKPFYKKNVEEAMSGWDGKILEEEEEQLAEKMGFEPMQRGNPYYRQAVEIIEVWSPELDYKFATIMNKHHVINKRPFERPLLTMNPNIFALRNVVVPGQMFGLSDYQESETIFTEMNNFRRIRADGATLTTLPAFVKQAGVNFTEAMKKIRPGMIITLPTADGISSLIKHTLPPEAYREPSEMRYDIEEATETYAAQKGATATVGRVTGTEYQGREANTNVKYAVDAGFVEEELAELPATILGLAALFTPGKLRMEIGGDPDALVDVTREQLIQAIGWRFRMRGASRHIQPDLQVQQVTMALKEMGQMAQLSPVEWRAALQLVFEMTDVRGWSKILTPEGMQTSAGSAAIAGGAMDQQNLAAGNAAAASQVPAPATMAPQQAAAAGGQPPAPPQGGTQ